MTPSSATARRPIEEPDPATDYARAVVEGSEPAGSYVKKACRRHLEDLERGAERGLRWSPQHAAYAVAFNRFIRHSKGEFRGKPLELRPWQLFIVGCAYGWLKNDPAKGWIRRFRTIYVEVPKKNGKSTLCSAIALFALIGDGEGGAEVYAAATARKQALLVFEEAKEMVRTSPALRSKITILTNNLSHDDSYSRFQPISADENTGDGINPSCAIFDELHRVKNPGLLNVLSMGMGARRQPMMWIITTAGDDRRGTPYDGEHNYARSIVEGNLKDDSYLAYIACPDEDDDPLEAATWRKANPNLEVSVSLADMKAQADKARSSPAAMAAFKRLRLNIRSSDADAAIKKEVWDRNTEGPIDPATLIGRKCRSAVDLSAKTDITCLVHLFEPREKGERWTILPRFFVPEEGVHDRGERDRGSHYATWIQQGWMTATPGNRVDYNFVLAQLVKDAKLFRPVDITFDPWNAGTLEADCQAEGFEVFEFPQNTAHYAHPTKEFLGMLLDAEFEHGNNPVLNWMAGNLALVRDHNDNPMPSKKKSTGRIDGIAATIMALGAALASGEPASADIIRIW